MNQNLFNKLTELFDTTPLETDMLEIINAYEKDKAEQSLQGDIMGNCYQCNSPMQYPTIAGYCSVKCAEEALNNESNIPKTSNPLVIKSRFAGIDKILDGIDKEIDKLTRQLNTVKL